MPDPDDLSNSDDLLIQPRVAILCLVRAVNLPADLPPHLNVLREAFCHNLSSIARILTIPHRVSHLTLAPDARRELGQLAQKAFREATAPGGLFSRLGAKAAALATFNDTLQAELIPAFYEKAAKRAREVLEHEDLNLAVRELFTQSLLLSWGAVEVLARDVFVCLLNHDPTLVKRLTTAKETKKIFGDYHLTLEDIAAAGFDLSTKLGELLSRHRSLDRLETIRAVYRGLFPMAASLHASLSDDALWLLYQRRHVIVHRRGVIDRTYLEKTGAELEVGSRLNISSDDALSSLTTASNVGTDLLLTAAGRA